MEKLTYKQAYDKIIEAYFKDEIKSMKMQFCFCGTISPDKYWDDWRGSNKNYPYTVDEYKDMEAALFEGMEILENGADTKKDDPYYEDGLFIGMAAALEVLKQIHKERGENVEDFQFAKRELV